VQLPGALPLIGSAVVLIGAAIAASVIPATRASRVDVLQALRSE
jgi:putative ABC transport system permease protein